MTLSWTEDLNTGIPVIDQQHQRIVECINRLESAILECDRNHVDRVFDKLVDYTLSHLAFEEAMQAEADYPLAIPHKAVHDQFARRIERYRQRHKDGEEVAIQVHGMLCTWLVHHIKRDDMAYVPRVMASLNDRLRDRQPDGWLGRMVRQVFA